MIKLICPECSSDDVDYINKDIVIDDWFKCNDCDHEFTYQDAWWQSF